MLFNSLEYAVFMSVVFVLFWALARFQAMRLLMLLVASYLFYASWNPSYLLLIVLSSMIDYTIGLGLDKAEKPGTRKALLIASIVVNLGVLAIFKYFNFFLTNIDAALGYSGMEATGWRLDLLLPVGISFYTFQTMSYSIDLYRGKIEVCRNPLKFFVYVAFFPQLVAGPIVRAVDFLPQLNSDRTLTQEDVGKALMLIMAGLIKKVAISDYLAVNLVDRVFDDPVMFSSLEALLGVYGYAMQIYCDFSGYTDIAIGSALLLGYKLPDNFNRPYKSDSLQDFWRRWHISLSSWLRDYLYIPLGGSRNSEEWKTYRNLMITMLLGGLWHGAAWNFVIWGALHGSALTVTRIWQRWRTSKGYTFDQAVWYKPLMVFLTFHFVCLTWIFFRAPTTEKAMSVISRIASVESLKAANMVPTVMLALAVGYGVHATPTEWRVKGTRLFSEAPAPVQALVLTVVLFVLKEIATSDVVPFIYFQF